MVKRKPSFFERLTGSVSLDEADVWEEPPQVIQESRELRPKKEWSHFVEEEKEEEAELAVDVFQTPTEVVLKTMVAGVRPEDLTIQITRDTATIRGKRQEERNVIEDDYIHQELYWGSFSRTISLPAEVDPDEAEAVERHGLLTIRLPKIDKAKTQRLKVKSA
jgi:HSP20 family molecular chaperone IbpA